VRQGIPDCGVSDLESVTGCPDCFCWLFSGSTLFFFEPNRRLKMLINGLVLVFAKNKQFNNYLFMAVVSFFELGKEY
jgi:hypothetical protein